MQTKEGLLSERSHIISTSTTYDDKAQPSQLPYSRCKLWAYVLSISLGSFQYGYSLGVYSPISKVLMQLYSLSRFPWSVSHRQPYNTLVGTLPQVGAFVGAFTAFLFVKKNRVVGIIVFNIVAILGAALSTVLNMPLLLLGRFINGYAAGAFSFLIPLFINEVSPVTVKGTTSMLVQLMITFGVFVPALLGLALPESTLDIDASYSFWKVIVLFPCIVSLFQIVLFATLYRHSTPPSYLSQSLHYKAQSALKLVYSEGGASQRYQQLVVQHLFFQSQSSKSELSKNPKKALLVCYFLQIFKQLTGISAIYFYSSQLFESQSDPQNLSDGIQVAVMLGAINFVASAIAIPFLEKLGRKLMLVVGFFVMCLADCLVGVFQLNQDTVLPGIMAMLFIVAYEFSGGPVLWVYIPQVLNTAGITIAAVMNWLSIILVSFVSPALKQSIGAWLFVIFGACNLIGGIFTWKYLIESKGRTKLEMHQLYHKTKIHTQYTPIN